MVRRIQALNYRCLRHVDVRLDGNFHILVGPNASGKSTLMDVIAFFADLTAGSVEGAVRQRVPDFRDLVWGRQASRLRFEMALEFEASSEDSEQGMLRYELAVRGDEDGPRIETVQGLAVSTSVDEPRSVSQFPEPLTSVPSILGPAQEQGARSLFRGAKGFTEYMDDVHSFIEKLDPERVAEGAFRELQERLDAARAVLQFEVLGGRVQSLLLDGRRLRAASPPADVRAGLSTDGGNLPWLVHHLIAKHRARFRAWRDHVRIVLTELKDIRVVEREDDHRAYLMLSYGAGVEVPSWSVSEGTLRLLALTLIAYLPAAGRIYLIEEPENGIHPLAIEAVYQSLSSVYDSHVFVTTHSPTLLGCASPREVLCFARDQEGATDVLSGADHPRLGEWRRAADMDLLFAPDVLG